MSSYEPPTWPQQPPHGAVQVPPQPGPAWPAADPNGGPWAQAQGAVQVPPGTHPSIPVQRSVGPVAPWQPVPPPRRGRGGLIAVLVAVVVLVAGGVGWFVWQGMAEEPLQRASAGVADEGAGKLDGDASAPAGQRPAEPTGEPPSDPAEEESTAPGPSGSGNTGAGSSPAADLEAEALADLDALRAGSLSRVVLDGRWVAQVASKYVGIKDPLQTAANGSHTFFAADILAESRAASARAGGAAVYVLWGTDFGRHSTGPQGEPFWITLVDAGFGGEDDVTEWCAQTYPELTPEQLDNTCAARTLSPPHD
jgi:hypothetical protein